MEIISQIKFFIKLVNIKNLPPNKEKSHPTVFRIMELVNRLDAVQKQSLMLNILDSFDSDEVHDSYVIHLIIKNNKSLLEEVVNRKIELKPWRRGENPIVMTCVR